ncbi:hypothetical protein JTE90_029566 [Oedothorax gibbosus]|uniref:Uncharacterized protein n=1 Tax=Oedothorax gibbosus TaxID=931172 RepID=A0AAV6VDU9_9ARAC|nr:hypothetical protein JTE90_029566 [Oedothorax gibbosus]
MAKVLGPITACFKKGEITEKEDNTYSSSDKNQGSTSSDVSNPGVLWRVSSQLYNVGSGAVGLGVGTVKWAASTTYNVGSGVVSATQTVVGKVVPSVNPKPKKE